MAQANKSTSLWIRLWITRCECGYLVGEKRMRTRASQGPCGQMCGWPVDACGWEMRASTRAVDEAVDGVGIPWIARNRIHKHPQRATDLSPARHRVIHRRADAFTEDVARECRKQGRSYNDTRCQLRLSPLSTAPTMTYCYISLIDAYERERVRRASALHGVRKAIHKVPHSLHDWALVDPKPVLEAGT